MLVAAAAMAFTSCQKEEVCAPETVSVNLTMHAGVEETKTFLGENNQVLWGKGETVKLYVGAGETPKFVSSKPTDAYENEATASFEFSISDVETSSSYNLGGIYPASAAVNNNENPAKFKVTLPDVQTAEVGKYDPSAYIMVLKPETVETLPTEYQASFRRATALNKITLTGVKENITSVEITVPEGKDFAGRRYFNLIEGTSGDIYYGQTSTITVNAPYTGESIDVWFCSWGVELAAGEELTVKMCAAENTYTRTITAKDSGITFAEGKLNTLKISMADINPDEQDKPEQPEQPEQPDGAAYYEKVTSAPVDWSGKYLIVYETGENAYVFNGKDEVNGYVAAKISDNKIASTSEIDAVAVTIEPMSGGYAIKTSAGYIYGNSSSNKLSFDSSQKLNTIEYSSTNDVTITSGRVLRFNSASNQMRYRYYSSETQQPIQLYRLAASNETPDLPDTTPAIVVSGETSKNVEFGGGEVTFNYELKNLDGEELTWEVSDEEMISSVSAEDGVLTVTVAENYGEERTANITLSCGDADDVVLILNQAEYVDASVIEEITVADFLSKSVDANVWYQLTGTIKEIKNTTYGNFYLEDETGYVYVYGLTKTQVSSNDKSFESIGLREGDTVTLNGTRAQYASAGVADQKEQVGGPAYYVSHVAAPYVELTMESASVDAETTSYTVDIKSNSNWKASASTDVTLDKTSGNGDASIKMTFTENTTSDAVTHTLTVAVEGSTKTFTLTQKGVVSGGDNEPVVVFAESFSKSTGTMGWSDNAGNGTFAADNTGWTVENAYGAGGSAKFGASKKLGKATTPALNITGNATLKFKAGAWTGDQTNLKLSMSGGTLSVTSVTMKNATWTEYEVTITNATSGAKVTFEGKQASKARFFLDDIEIIQN